MLSVKLGHGMRAKLAQPHTRSSMDLFAQEYPGFSAPPLPSLQLWYVAEALYRSPPPLAENRVEEHLLAVIKTTGWGKIKQGCEEEEQGGTRPRLGGSPTFLCMDHFTNRTEEGEEKPYLHPNIPTSGSPRKQEK